MGNGTARLLKLSYSSGKTVVIPTVAAFATPVVRFSSKTREIRKDKFRVQNTLLFFKAGDSDEIFKGLSIFYLLPHGRFSPLNAVFIACGP